MSEPIPVPSETGGGGTAERLASACPLDCPDACSLEVTVENGRVVKVDGASDRNALTEGYICAKVRRMPQHLYGPERLRTPLRRRGPKGAGEFEPLSWDEALELAARKLVEVRDRFGGEAILPYCYGGSNGALTQDTLDALLFGRLGASRLARTVCAAATGRAAVGLYGKMEGVAPVDYRHARLIVVWGANPSATGIHLVPQIQAARSAGARLVVVDPRATPLAKQADLHLQLLPGTDLAVALAVHRELFARGAADLDFLERHATGIEELRRRAEPWTLARAAALSGVPGDDLARFVDLYATSTPALIRCGWGLERNRNGGSAVAAVLALPAVAGKFGVRGGGYTMSNSSAWKLDASPLVGSAPETRVINMNRLGEALTATAEPAVRLLFVYNSNALVTTPNANLVEQGMLRDDLFTIVFDQVMTDTAALADLILPATTFLEHRELSRGYGAYVLQDRPAVVAAEGEARSNLEVFGELARRTGVAGADEIPGAGALADVLLDRTGRGEEIRRQLRDEGVARPAFGDRPVQFVDVFPKTRDRRIHLVPKELDREAPLGLYGFQADPATANEPLTLISPATNRTISSTLGQLRKEQVPLRIHPDDAAARGISTGDRIRVTNRYGELVCRAQVSPEMRPGVVELPKGLWRHNTENGATACSLAPDSLTDLGAGACFNDARVEVSRA
ncbi:MAG: molybdopterin-dependent oxidoreductase [Thermoanaerobaculia bacterium]